MIPHKANTLKALLVSYCLRLIIQLELASETSTAPALGADTAKADQASSERCATKPPLAEVQSEHKRNNRKGNRDINVWMQLGK